MPHPRLLLPALCLLGLTTYAQAPLPQWHHLDPADKAMGISTDRAYELLRTLPNKPKARPIIVAVIDGGIDTAHVDLRHVLWHNPKEIPANGRDDDHNGYVDDVFGWNFTGGADGRNVFENQKEDTRLYARLKPLYEHKTAATVPPAKQAEFRLYEQAKKSYTTNRAKAEAAYQQDSQELAGDLGRVAALKKAYGVAVLDSGLLHHPPTLADTALTKLTAQYYRWVRGKFPNLDTLANQYIRYNAGLKRRLDYDYNLAYNPQPLVGDHPNDLTERHYGNNNLRTDPRDHGTEHGTHCTGIIAADRTNNLGVRGVAEQVRILGVRAIPNGDERDKDVANAIRYAVDNGASIISMSFAKYFSPEKNIVDEAMRYANAKGVLLVHGAGNDHLNYDSIPAFPSTRFLNGQTIPNLITVGASARTNDERLVATFSNYGPKTVDVFAPGVDIISTYPNNQYHSGSGTSMAAPVVAGIAAVLKVNFPHLTHADLKRIILASAAPVHTQVRKPGTKQLVDFATLSRTGGIVNLYEAVRLASLTPVPAVTVSAKDRSGK
ncbi:S8 family serine peptidase [Hymenobacter monticola]|uniref:S8 family serine peptidase n=1 Tax=Hymenobacter monticola TaxID=1705399 RepID=A0ABY4B082_9BACT|nr:S8 family serine peptidase [Hymenobacter monticola]UOE32547.1 S8 family serine peptidase [Hymenobacter monticola]